MKRTFSKSVLPSVSALVLAALLAGGCGGSYQGTGSNSDASASTAQTGTPLAEQPTTPYPGVPTSTPVLKGDNGLTYIEITPGMGTNPKPGDHVTVHYSGYLLDGTKFDSSVDKGRPYTFTIGRNKVVKGWDIGIMTMKIGEKRKLIIPPELGYGARGFGGGIIPPNATMVFDVELLSID